MKYTLSIMLSLFTTMIMAQDRAMEKVEKFLEKELKKADVHNLHLSVYSDSRSIDWNFAMGQFKDGTSVTKDHPYFTASIGKTFTATAVAMLVEQGRLGFDEPIRNHLSADLMKGLHLLNGVDYSDSIRVSHLLQHTSGLPDYFEGKTIDGRPNMLTELFADTSRFWHPNELIQFAKDRMVPNFAPGTGYRYTDTEYILLGLIIENISGVSFNEFLSMNIFDPLGMNHTYLNLRSKPREKTPKMSEIYLSDAEVGAFSSLSADWAGGGLVSTGEDLLLFQKALWEGRLIQDETFMAMQDWMNESKGMWYGYGLRRIRFKKLFPTLPDWTVIGHSGLNGSFMFYCPDLDTYISGTLNQTDQVRVSVTLMVKTLMVVNKVNE